MPFFRNIFSSPRVYSHVNSRWRVCDLRGSDEQCAFEPRPNLDKCWLARGCSVRQSGSCHLFSDWPYGDRSRGCRHSKACLQQLSVQCIMSELCNRNKSRVRRLGRYNRGRATRPAAIVAKSKKRSLDYLSRCNEWRLLRCVGMSTAMRPWRLGDQQV